MTLQCCKQDFEIGLWSFYNLGFIPGYYLFFIFTYQMVLYLPDDIVAVRLQEQRAIAQLWGGEDDLSPIFWPVEGKRATGVCGAPHRSHVSLPARATQLISQANATERFHLSLTEWVMWRRRNKTKLSKWSVCGGWAVKSILTGPNFIALLTAECCAHDHHSFLTGQVLNFCASCVSKECLVT